MKKITFLTFLSLFFTFSFAQDYSTKDYSQPEQKQIKTINPNDTDNDLVPNDKDMCPDTPEGVCVFENGCTQVLKYTINFPLNSYKIDKEFRSVINTIIQIAQECKGYKITINGHTDSTASESFNIDLSKKRALVIKELLILNNINPDRITLHWFGETKPIETNITSQGRYENRRAEIFFE